jgi:threonine synthase
MDSAEHAGRSRQQTAEPSRPRGPGGASARAPAQQPHRGAYGTARPKQSHPPARGGTPASSRAARGGDTPAARLLCARCGGPAQWAFLQRCGSCGGALEPGYDLTAASIGEDTDPCARYFDLLPIASRDSLLSGACVRTPCRKAVSLGRHIGLPGLWLKAEYLQPTGSTKDRMAAVVVPVFREFGVSDFVASSTGNSSTALARAVGLSHGIRAHLFCARRFVSRHAHLGHPGVELHVVDGDFVAAEARAKAFAADAGHVWEGGFFNWARREGLKLAYLEAFDQMPVQPDVVVQAISSGMGMVGAQKGIEEYRALGRLTGQPRMLMVQQATCAPMAQGWRDGKRTLGPEDVVVNPSGLAAAILRGDAAATYPYVFDIAARSRGDVVAVSAAELVAARDMLRQHEGIDVCYASAACLAAVLQQLRGGRIQRGENVLVNLTGSEREAAR